ncbi:uncharacterized protein LOC113799780 [Dermatophagoides pteronyssinus]|uniref:uncharacterized protein LOC113799780 n=1 Tax=Dermatophagoides pteronyssinus TaxID=6956 RepID=UPI003F67349D
MFANNVFIWFCFLLSSLSSFLNAIPYPLDNQQQSIGVGTKPRLKSFNFESNILDGQTVRVFCQLIDGSQPLSFQWLKNGQPLSSTTSIQHSSSSLPYYTSSSLPSTTLTNSIDIQTFPDYSSLAIYRIDRQRDSGNYTCLVSNSYGSDQYSSLLIVQEPPSFLEKPSDITIGLKKSILLKCRATISSSSSIMQGHLKPIIKWNRLLFDNVGSSLANNMAIPDARREQISSGEQLHLTDIRIEDAGIYECMAENPHNRLTISHQFTITVNVPAYFKVKTDQIEVKRGETAKLICEAFGARPLQIEWLKQQSITGEFKRLDLDYVPDFVNSFPRYTALEKNFDSTYFEQWEFNSPQINNNKESMKSIPYVNNNRTLFELHINSVDSMDNGQYGCRIWNDYGEDIRRINLFVQDVPGQVRQLQLDQIWTSEASISWSTPESIGNLPLTQYLLQYWKEIRLPNLTMISSGSRLHEIELQPTITNYMLKNLQPGTLYAVRVIAVNQFGHGQSGQLLRFQTEQESPSSSPIDILAEPQGTTAIHIKWKAPPKNHWNGHLKGYYLGYRLINIDEQQQQLNNNNNNNDISLNNNNNAQQQQRIYKQIEFNGLADDNYQEEYILSGLNKGTLYGIILKCFNDVGEGPSSPEVFVSTAIKDPPPKPTLTLVETKENSVQIKWNKDLSMDDDISHFILAYKEDKKSKWMELELVKSKLINDDNNDEQYYYYNLNGLQRGTNYHLYLRSINRLDKNSISEPSDQLTIRTEGEGSSSLMNMLNSNIESPQSPQQSYHAIAAIPTAAFLPTLSTNFHQPSLQQQVPPYFRISFIIPIAIAIVVIVIACVGAYVYIRIDDRNQQIKLYNSTAAVAANVTAVQHHGTLAIGPGKRFQYISPGNGHNNGKIFNQSITPSSLNSSAGLLRDNSCTQSLVSEESSLSFRYSDSSSDKGRPLLSRPPLSSNASMIPSGVQWAQQQSPIPEEDESAAGNIVDLDSTTYETLPFQKNEQFKQSTPNMQSFQQQQQSKSPAFPPPPPPLPGATIFKASPLNRPNITSNNNNNNNMFCHHVDVHHTQSSSCATSDANNSDSYDDFRFFSRV